MDYMDASAAGQARVIAAAASGRVSAQVRVMGVCLVVDKTRTGVQGLATIDPSADAATLLSKYESKDVGFIPVDDTGVVRQPQHGKLTKEKDATGSGVYAYRPDFGWIGRDQFEVVVPFGSRSVRIAYFAVVQGDQITDAAGFEVGKYCPLLNWKISDASVSSLFLSQFIGAVRR